jgi:hypothetical protein
VVDENEVRLWISRLETEESSWPNYQKLAALYIIQNQNAPKEPERPMLYSASPAPVKTYASETVGRYGDSDFLQAVSGMAPARAWEVMDELMDSLKIVNERVYNSVMRKLEK